MRFTAGIAVGVAGSILLLGAGPSMAAGDVVDVGGEPLNVVIDAEGTAYIGDYHPGGGVSVLPAGASKPTETLATGVGPAGMALSADGTLYVEGWDFDQQQEKLAVVPKGSSEVARTIPLGRGAHLIAAAPDGTVFVPNPLLGTVSVIAPGAGTVSRTIDVRKVPDSAGAPHGIAIGPDGTVYVTNITSNDVAVIKPGDSVVAYRVPVPGGPKEIAVGPDSTVYVLSEASSLSVIAPGGISHAWLAHRPGAGTSRRRTLWVCPGDQHD